MRWLSQCITKKEFKLLLTIAEARKHLKKTDLTDEQLKILLELMEEVAWMVLNENGDENGDKNDSGRISKLPAPTKPFVGRGNNKNPR